jgi:hypothetical protein
VTSSKSKARLQVAGAVVDRIHKLRDECWGDFNYKPEIIRSWYPEDPDVIYDVTGETRGLAFSHLISADFGTVGSSYGGCRGFPPTGGLSIKSLTT